MDYRILHITITEQATRDATQFYTLFYNAPPAIKVSLAHSTRYDTGRCEIGLFAFNDGYRNPVSAGKAAQVGRERYLV